MSYNETGTHKKRRIAHPWVFRGTASAPFVPAQDLRAHGNSLSPHPRPLSTAVLARTIGKLPKHHASVSAKSRDVNSTGDLAVTLLESALASNPTLTGGVIRKFHPRKFHPRKFHPRKFHPAKIPPSENSTQRKFHPAKIRLG